MIKNEDTMIFGIWTGREKVIKNHKKVCIICIVVIIFLSGTMYWGMDRSVDHNNENQNNSREINSEEQEIPGWLQAERYLEQEIPELVEYDRFISKKTEGKAFLIIETVDIEADELYGNNHEFIGNYYMVYVGEQWEDHRANWYWFHVREDLKEILWCEITECEFYSLEEWRASLEYKEQMERITEYLKENE
ncbi:MAG: hypothetical protein HDQ96_05140 [Lachnospiraceae bacterium]|nr:hypothetical protein [Lachnospiraceae bacterium]